MFTVKLELLSDWLDDIQLTTNIKLYPHHNSNKKMSHQFSHESFPHASCDWIHFVRQTCILRIIKHFYHESKLISFVLLPYCCHFSLLSFYEWKSKQKRTQKVLSWFHSVNMNIEFLGNIFLPKQKTSSKNFIDMFWILGAFTNPNCLVQKNLKLSIINLTASITSVWI